MNETDTYKQWLTEGRTDRAIIETLEITHGSDTPIYACNWDRDVSATIEDTSQVTFLAARFFFEPAAIEDSLSQSAQLTVASYDGVVYDVLNDMPLYTGGTDDRRTEIEVKVRLYFHDDLTAQLVNPAPVWNVHSASATFDVVNLSLSNLPLRDKKVGLYYVAREFPILRYIL